MIVEIIKSMSELYIYYANLHLYVLVLNLGMPFIQVYKGFDYATMHVYVLVINLSMKLVYEKGRFD